MRGFSEALRRELEDTGVSVTYVAPRYTKTPLNDGAVSRMAQAIGMNSDEPATVAQHVIRAIEKDSKDYYIGWPECLFVRINALLPRLVDIALRKQNTQMRAFAVKN
jgi:short-subunit dehydrogenase